MGKRTDETERKYEAVGRSGEPDLAGLPGVEATDPLDPVMLDAVYFDTEDLTLAVRHVTLRRRTGGDDAGWHLKIPSDRPDTRTEVHAPLGAVHTVPRQFATEVAVHVRGRTLRPVVRLTNDRHRIRLLGADGRQLAEIARDHVTAHLLGTAVGPPFGWTETEVELGEGAPALLDAVEERLAAAGLHRSGAPSKLAHALGDRLSSAPRPPRAPDTLATTGDAVLTYLHRQWHALTVHDPAVRRDEYDAVHQMRVATRRLRSALKSFRRETDRTVTDRVGAELKWAAGELGMERDREVLDERLESRLAELDPGLVTARLTDRLREDREAAHARSRAVLLRSLDSDRYFALLDSLEALLTNPPLRSAAGAPAEQALRAVVRRDHRRLRRLVESALRTPPGEGRDLALHEARKAAKRARYSSEAAQAVLGGPAVRHTSRMKSVQQLLGEHQDSVMCVAAVARLSEKAEEAGEDTAPYRAIAGLERSRAAAVESALPKAWRKADHASWAG